MFTHVKPYDCLIQAFGSFAGPQGCFQYFSGVHTVSPWQIYLELFNIDWAQWDSQIKHMKWALPFRRFYLSRRWNVGQTYLHLTNWNPIQTPLGKTLRFGWQQAVW